MFLLVILICLLLVNKRSKLLYTSALIFMWIIFGWCGEIADKEIYEARFYHYDESWFQSITEPIYNYTIFLFHEYHISFQGSYIIISLLFLVSLTFYIKNTSKNIGFILALIMMSTYAMHVILLRTTYALSFVLIAMYILLYTKWSLLYKTISYTSLIIFASTIHFLCILYLPFLALLYLSSKNIWKCLWIYMPLAVLGMGGIATGLLPDFMNYFGMSEKMEIFLSNTNTTTNKLIQYILALLRVLSVIILPWGIIAYQKKNKAFSFDDIDKKIISLNIISLFIVPLLYISHDLYRIFYVLAIVNYCMATKYIRYPTILTFTILCALNIGYWFIWRPYFNFFLDVFNNNLLL